MSIEKITQTLRGLPTWLVIAGAGLILLLSANGILGTYSLIAGIISHSRDRAFDKEQEKADKVIDSLIKQSEDLRKEVAQSEQEKKVLRVEIQAKDTIIASAGARIEERSKQVEEIKNELQNETDRIDASNDPDAISNELRARLKKRGLLKD